MRARDEARLEAGWIQQVYETSDRTGRDQGKAPRPSAAGTDEGEGTPASNTLGALRFEPSTNNEIEPQAGWRKGKFAHSN